MAKFTRWPCFFVAWLGSVAGAQQFDEMLVRSLPSPRAETTFVAVLDLDADGDLDIVCAGSNRFYRNRGDGVFTDETVATLPMNLGETMAIASGDFDNDNDVDLVFAAGMMTPAQDRLLFNDGSGRFTDVTATHLPTDTDPTMAVASGDIDGDGDIDLVFGNSGMWNDPVRVYANDGTGAFANVTTAWLGGAPLIATSVALADVDLDGDHDLLLNAPVRLMRNQGGAFTDVSATHVPPGIDAATFVVADVDNDGDSDVYCPFFQGSRLLLNSGGVFTDMTATHLPPGMLSSWEAASVDLEGDGDMDIVDGVRILRNSGTGVFTAALQPLPGYLETVTGIAHGDVDRDGDVDLVIGSRERFGGHDHLLLGDGTGAFLGVTPPRVPPNFSGGGHLVSGDFDNDGDVDLASFGMVSWLARNDGGGWFTEVGASAMPALPSLASMATTLDADGDGDLDFVVGGNGPDELLVNDGNGVFSLAPAGMIPHPFAVPMAMASGDFDRDGDMDLVYGTNPYSPILLDNRGGGRFVDTWQIPSTFGPGVTTALAVGDVDADGDLDIVAGNDGVQNRLYRNLGTGVFVDATASLPVDLDATLALALVDVDADGDLDLFCANSLSTAAMSAQDRLYLNDGNGSFTDATATRLPIDGHSVTHAAAGDVDNDGDVDLLLLGTCWGCDAQRFYQNDGAGHFTDATATYWPSVPTVRDLTLGDFDRDGDLDLATGFWAPRIVQMNLLRQLHAPWPARVGRMFALEVWQRGAAGATFAIPFLSTTRLSGITTPFGELGIQPMLILPPIAVPYPDGVGTLTFTVPALPVLVGATFYAQALMVTSPAAVHLTGVTKNVVLP